MNIANTANEVKQIPPTFLPAAESEFPPEIGALESGLVPWRWEPKEGVETPRPVKDDWAKVPRNVRTSGRAVFDTTTTLKKALAWMSKHGGHGVNLHPCKRTRIVAIDIDDTKGLPAVILDLGKRLGVVPYIEPSPSGQGLRVLMRVDDDFAERTTKKIHAKGCKEIEFIYGAHWVAITGRAIGPANIPHVDSKVLHEWWVEHFDKPKGKRAKHHATPTLTDEQLAPILHGNEVYQRLRVGDLSDVKGDASDAVGLMAYTLACLVDDAEQIKRIMNQSALPDIWGDKWNRVDSDGPLLDKIIAKKIEAAAHVRNRTADETHYERRADGMYEKGYRRGNPVEHRMSTIWVILIAVNSREYGDGRIPDVTLTLLCGVGDKSVEVTLAPEDLEHTSWVSKFLALMFPTADILPGFSGREFKAAILQTSPEDQIVRRVVYCRIGWFKHGGEYVYITRSGAIGTKGLDTTVTTSLAVNFRHYSLPTPPEGQRLKDALLAVLEFMAFRSPEVMFPALAAMVGSVLGNSRLTIHLVGQPGAGKTELACLLMRLFGYEFTSAEPTATWGATANALVGLLAQSAYAPVWVDDLIVDGDERAISQVGHKIDEVVGAQGNGQGRDRCGRDGKPLPPLVLLGLLLSTGEGWLGRESRTARTLQLSLGRDDLNADRFQAVKAKSHLFSEFMAAFVQWAASRLDELRKHVDERVAEFERREEGGRHARYGRNTGWLVGVFEVFTRFASECGAIDTARREQLNAEARRVIVEAIRRQSSEEVSAKPHDLFLDSLRVAFATGDAKLIVIDNEKLNAKLVGGHSDRANLVGYVVGTDVYLLPTPSRKVAIASATAG